MFVWVLEAWHQVPESPGPPLTIYQEKFHLPNRVKLNFLNSPLLGNWPSDYTGHAVSMINADQYR